MAPIARQMNYVTLRWGWSPGLSAVFFILVGLGMAVYPRLLIPRYGEAACLQAGCVISIVNSLLVGLDPTGTLGCGSWHGCGARTGVVQPV